MTAYCLKCKTQTPSKDVQIVKTNNRNIEKSLCSVCGSKKNKFMSGLKGKGIEQTLSKEAYNDQPKEEIEGYKLDKDLSNKKTRVYHNADAKKTVVAHRGTVITDKNDLKNDLLLTAGLLNKSKRFKNALDISKKAEQKYSDSELTNLGHSLGGKLASNVGQKMSVKNSKVETYNAGASPLEIPLNLLNKGICSVSNSNACKKLKAQKHNLTGIDPISISNLTAVGKKKIILPKSLNVHGIDNFQTGKGDCKCKK